MVCSLEEEGLSGDQEFHNWSIFALGNVGDFEGIKKIEDSMNQKGFKLNQIAFNGILAGTVSRGGNSQGFICMNLTRPASLTLLKTAKDMGFQPDATAITMVMNSLAKEGSNQT